MCPATRKLTDGAGPMGYIHKYNKAARDMHHGRAEGGRPRGQAAGRELGPVLAIWVSWLNQRLRESLNLSGPPVFCN